MLVKRENSGVVVDLERSPVWTSFLDEQELTEEEQANALAKELGKQLKAEMEELAKEKNLEDRLRELLGRTTQGESEEEIPERGEESQQGEISEPE